MILPLCHSSSYIKEPWLHTPGSSSEEGWIQECNLIHNVFVDKCAVHPFASEHLNCVLILCRKYCNKYDV